MIEIHLGDSSTVSLEELSRKQAVFAEKVQVGDCLYVLPHVKSDYAHNSDNFRDMPNILFKEK